MTEGERLVRFKLLDQDFAFYTAASEEEMEAILNLVREQLKGGGDLPRGTVPASKIAMMACLKMASKYLQLEREFAEYRNTSVTHFARLSKEISDNL